MQAAVRASQAKGGQSGCMKGREEGRRALGQSTPPFEPLHDSACPLFENILDTSLHLKLPKCLQRHFKGDMEVIVTWITVEKSVQSR